MGKAVGDGVRGGRSEYQESNGVEEKGSNELLSATGRKGYWEVVGK